MIDVSVVIIFTALAAANLFGILVLSIKMDQIREKLEEVLRWI